MRSIEGNAVVGQSLTIFIQPPGSRDMRFRPTVLVVEPKRELRWKAASGLASEKRRDHRAHQAHDQQRRPENPADRYKSDEANNKGPIVAGGEARAARFFAL
jgi:hypothetical protein